MPLEAIQLEKLSPLTRQRLNALDEDADAALAVARAATQKIGDARAAKQHAEGDEKRLVAYPAPVFNDRQSAERRPNNSKSQLGLDAAAARTAEATRAFERTQENGDEKNAIWTPKAQTYHRLNEGYVPHALRNGGLEDADVGLPRGVTIETATDQVEVETEKLAAVRNSTLPIAEIKAAAHQIVADRALPLQLAVNDLLRVNVRPPLVGAGGPDAFALLAYYLPDVVLADLDAQAEALVAGRLQFTVEERRERLAAAKADLLAAEMVLGELIWAGFAGTGTGLDFPATLDPRAILGVIGCAPKAP